MPRVFFRVPFTRREVFIYLETEFPAYWAISGTLRDGEAVLGRLHILTGIGG